VKPGFSYKVTPLKTITTRLDLSGEAATAGEGGEDFQKTVSEGGPWLKNGEIGIFNADKGQPLLFDLNGKLVSDVDTFWVPGRGTLPVPGQNKTYIWFYTGKDSSGARDWSLEYEISFAYNVQGITVYYDEVKGWSDSPFITTVEESNQPSA
jgi:hypothetical protein